ncbi:hypothetical protein A0H81_14728 [Grifola frondosa]|uniref:Secreted protein n=1 Tax=Grifola frondosa TaxID=5627 RepID=A0A1C7LLA5_GRIFR|nr:hypothetical protein A0H81_14728 [Grifola frondosa]
MALFLLLSVRPRTVGGIIMNAQTAAVHFVTLKGSLPSSPETAARIRSCMLMSFPGEWEAHPSAQFKISCAQMRIKI